MTPFDLLFIIAFLAAAGVLIGALVAALSGRRDRALRRLRRLALGIVIYMVAVTAVSLVTPRPVVGLGHDQCSDDWCIAVTGITRVGGDTSSPYLVSFRLSSRARGVSQRERFVVAYLLDSAGQRHDAAPANGQAPFDTLLHPGESIVTQRTFAVPSNAAGLGVVVAREGGFDFPGCCILGQGLFHKPPITYPDRK